MTGLGEKLSAYIDGELSDAEAREVEGLVENDPAIRAELEALMAADAAAAAEFDRMLDHPVPLRLAAALKQAPNAATAPPPAPRGLPAWAAIAASVVFLAVGTLGGYIAGAQRPVQMTQAPAWLEDIADYHAIYSTQTRHLVEVSAAESDHLESWLTDTVGAVFRIPDLSAFDLTFQGGRLLVAAGRPVAQLMYTDATGTVVALCFIASETPADAVDLTTIGGFDMVSWGGDDANFVVVAPEGYDALDAIAESAALAV